MTKKEKPISPSASKPKPIRRPWDRIAASNRKHKEHAAALRSIIARYANRKMQIARDAKRIADHGACPFCGGPKQLHTNKITRVTIVQCDSCVRAKKATNLVALHAAAIRGQ